MVYDGVVVWGSALDDVEEGFPSFAKLLCCGGGVGEVEHGGVVVNGGCHVARPLGWEYLGRGLA
eukprot:15403626-Alexandrium_andersonii.AAC.1